jgi:group I intron endonuclease
LHNKIYVGSAKCLRYRIHRHLNDLKNGTHASNHLQNSFNLYGIDEFSFQILEEFDSYDRTHLIEREQYYLDTLEPWNREIGYNTCQVAGSPEHRVLSDEHKEKIRKSLIGHKCSLETRNLISISNKGKVNSPKAIEQMRLTKIGLKQSEECIEKRAKKYSFIDLDGNIYIGTNLKRFAEKYKCHRFNLNKVLSGKRKSHNGFKLYIQIKN